MVTQSPYTCAPPLPVVEFAQVRRQVVFDCCKWDPQVEDVSVLVPFPLVLDASSWRRLARWAEALAGETMAMEAELVRRPVLHRRLALPRKIARALRDASRFGTPVGLARVMRFDFHWTTDGWRITEVNSDVPGGYVEASGFTRLMADCYPQMRLCGDPANALAEAISRRLRPGAMVGLVHASAYTDDRQVMIYLSRSLENRGLRTCLLSPDQLRWEGGRARICTRWCQEPAEALVRFFPAEWLMNLPRRCGWRLFFAGSEVPTCNPGTALLTQSKRVPLIWDALGVPVPTWRKLLPETRDPRDVPWAGCSEWVLKPALGRVGDGVMVPGVGRPEQSHRIARSARWFPSQWIAQRRFEAVPVQTPQGLWYPCIGVYTVDGVAAGVYGRLARTPLIDDHAREVAVLIGDQPEQQEHASHGPAELQPVAV